MHGNISVKLDNIVTTVTNSKLGDKLYMHIKFDSTVDMLIRFSDLAWRENRLCCCCSEGMWCHVYSMALPPHLPGVWEVYICLCMTHHSYPTDFEDGGSMFL
jgi:hypothetical protein